jgi:hypothetical protein
VPINNLLSYIRRKNKPTDVEKKGHVPSFSSLVKARLEFKKVPCFRCQYEGSTN